MKSFLKVTAVLLAAAQFAMVSVECQAGDLVVKRVSCNCSQGSGSYGPMAHSYAGPAPSYEGHALNSPAYGGDLVGNGLIDHGPVDHGPADHGPIGPPPGALAFGGGPVAAGPPPGTVGMTYRRPARYVPEDKHPRMGMLVVEAAGATAMAVEGMKGFQDTDGFWQFESKEPLIPGIPHIYHVKARLGEGPDAPVEFRTVRLIPGRIIDLDW